LSDSQTTTLSPAHHHHDPSLLVQFDTPYQQKDASQFGMWVFLITEIMFFGGLFGFNYDRAEKGEKLIPADVATQTSIFFALYFAMTGMHALHMIIGVGILIFLIYRASHGAYPPHHYTMVENFGLYWHFVDIIWIFLFPLLYLVSRSPVH